MIYKELKKYCDEKIKKYPEHEKKYKKEIIIAKRFYDNNRNLFDELTNAKEKISTRYVIPFLLGLTKKITDEPFEYIQVKSGVSGGIDIDSDFSALAKGKIQEYLKDKYGEDCVVHVGAFSRLGIASAAKDLLRVYKINFTKSNSFTKKLDSKLSWKENLSLLKNSDKNLYKFYEDHKEILDLVPNFINKIRQVSVHAGGIVILPSPVYEHIPVDRVKGKLVSAFPESSSTQILDELGYVKFDILAISILDVVRKSIDMIEEPLFLIKEDGVAKIVCESYIKEKEKS